MPVETGWSDAEIVLCRIIPFIAAAGCVSIYISKRLPRFSAVDFIAMAWAAYSLCRCWLDSSYPAAGYAMRMLMMSVLYLSLRLFSSRIRQVGYIFSCLILLFSLLEAGEGILQVISGTSRHHLYPATGSFLNPGPYSAYLTLGLVIALSISRIRHDDIIVPISGRHAIRMKTENMAMAAASLLLAMIILTMSRAAFVASSICCIIIFKDTMWKWRWWVAAVAIPVATALYFMKSGSADGRWVINRIGALCISDNPLFGGGIGSFFYLFSEKTAEVTLSGVAIDIVKVDVISYSFNDLLRVGVEQGLVGLFIVVGLIIMVMFRLLHSSRPLFLSMLSLLIISLFSYPFELLPFQIIATVAAAYAGSVHEIPSCGTRPVKNFTLNFITILCVSLIISTAVCKVADIVGIRKKAQEEYSLIAHNPHPAFTDDYYSLLPFLDDNKRFLFDFARLLAAQSRYNDSNEMLKRGTFVSNDPMFHVLTGNNYLNMGEYDAAEREYLVAWRMMPNRIYPLYRLMKLHQTVGDTARMVDYAGKVVEFRTKVSSPATTDMKREARLIISEM